MSIVLENNVFKHKIKTSGANEQILFPSFLSCRPKTTICRPPGGGASLQNRRNGQQPRATRCGVEAEPTRASAAATQRPQRPPGRTSRPPPAGNRSHEAKNMPIYTFFQAEKLFCIIKKHYFWGAAN